MVRSLISNVESAEKQEVAGGMIKIKMEQREKHKMSCIMTSLD